MCNVPKDSKYTFLGVAPDFRSDSTGDYHPLFHNIPEVEHLSQLLDGQSLVRNFANKKSLLSNHSEFKILHFSSHAFMKDSEKSIPFILLRDSQDEETYSKLDVSEIMQYDFRIPLVTLSTCKSQDGPLLQGEGILSLNRAFTLSGCGSIVSSLWEVDEQASKVFMDRFYTNLKNGADKNKALREAKFYLLDSTSFVEPYYWGAFILHGDSCNLELEEESTNFLYLIGFLIFIMFILKYFFRQ